MKGPKRGTTRTGYPLVYVTMMLESDVVVELEEQARERHISRSMILRETIDKGLGVKR